MALENFGFDEGWVMGRVIAVEDGERATLLILEDRSNPTYPNTIACEFYGDRNRAQLEGVQPGELVKVTGSVRSRRYKERWYTTFSCFSLAHFDAIRTPPPPAPPERKPQHRAQSGDAPLPV